MRNIALINIGTPVVNVIDNRGLTVRNLEFCRTSEGIPSDQRISFTSYSPAGKLQSMSDPRFAAIGRTNFTNKESLAGIVLHCDGADNGETWIFNDILGRTLWRRTSAYSVTTYAYDALGRPLTASSTDLSASIAAPIVRKRCYYGDTAPASILSRSLAQTANLCGHTIMVWDSAGQQAVTAASLDGVALSVTRRMLLKSDTEGDWSGDDTQMSTWQLWENALNKTHYLSTMTCNAIGDVLTHTDASGHLRRQTYDVSGRIIRKWIMLKGQSEQAILLDQTYNAAGLPLTQCQGNGITVSNTYEPATQRLTGTSISRDRAGNQTLLQALFYTYDPVGNVLTLTDKTQSTTWFRNQQVSPLNTFSYDSLYQVMTATGREAATQKNQTISLPDVIIPLPADSSQYTTWTRNYTYDRGGNLTRIRHCAPKTGNQWTNDIVISPTTNRGVNSMLFDGVTPDNINSLFDQRGNQTQLQPGQPVFWDVQGRLHQVGNNAGTNRLREYYGYAGASRIIKVREQRTQNIVKKQKILYLEGLELHTTFRDMDMTEIMEVLNLKTNDCDIRVLHWELGKPAEIDNDSIRYTYGNQSGSYQLELDHQGNIVSREEYYPYGGTAVWASKNQTEANYKVRRYSGKERDATGMYYYGYRYYQPWSGRWMSTDPAGIIDGLNLYQMVRNNPISNNDEYGLSITIGKKKYKTDTALKDLKKSQLYQTLSESYATEKIDKLISHYNNGDEVFLSDSHFSDLLMYDIHSDIVNDVLDDNQLAQSNYLTKSGWQRRLKGKVSSNDYALTQRSQAFWKSYKFAKPATPLNYVDSALSNASSSSKINVYRTMTNAEADEILTNKNYDAIGAHLGDFSQALTYFHRDGDGKSLLEFPLKAGAHEILFTPKFSAVLDTGNVTSVMAKLAELELGEDDKYAKAKKGEGTLSGYIGIKPEEHGVSGFSLSIGDKSSRALFKKFVDIDSVKQILRK